MTRVRRLTSRGLSLLALFALVAQTSLADDLAPAPFRGQPNSVMAKFDLFQGPTPGGPSQITFGANPTYQLHPIQPTVSAPISNPTTGTLDYIITLPNYIDQEPIKYFRIQYSWFGALPGSGPTGDAFVSQFSAVPNATVQLVGGTPPTLVPGSTNVYHRWDDFEIRPNPDFEEFTVSFVDADPRWVIIDTISIPEPATVGLLSLGALALLRRRR